MKRNRNYKTTTTTELDYMRVIKIGIGVLIALALVYFITAIASGEIKLGKQKEEKPKTVIQYEEIMAGETFNRPAGDYYVLYMNFTDNYASYYLSQIEAYKNKDDNLPFYIVDLEKKVNYSYATDDLNVSNPTILKISNASISDRISGQDDIIDFFSN